MKMNQKILETFNLEEIAEELKTESKEVSTELTNPIPNAPTEHHFIEHDSKMDEVSEKAMKAFQDLLDYGFNVEARNAGEIFATAGKFLELASKNADQKLDKRLKILDLQIKKAKLTATTEQVTVQEGTTMEDRNELLNLAKQIEDDRKKV